MTAPLRPCSETLAGVHVLGMTGGRLVRCRACGEPATDDEYRAFWHAKYEHDENERREREYRAMRQERDGA